MSNTNKVCRLNSKKKIRPSQRRNILPFTKDFHGEEQYNEYKDNFKNFNWMFFLGRFNVFISQVSIAQYYAA